MTSCSTAPRWDSKGPSRPRTIFPKQVTPEYLRHLKHLAFRLGLDISGTAVGNDFCHPPGAKREGQIAHVKQWIDWAEILGAPVIRIFSGSPQGGQTVDEAHRLAVEAIEECCDYAGRHGVFLALENHGGADHQGRRHVAAGSRCEERLVRRELRQRQFP